MALTRQQAVLAGLLLLAGEAAAAAALPGATIAQQAAAEAAQDKAAGKFGHTGPPKKVATPKGAAFYKAPLGSLIIPHEHYVNGQPGHMVHDISQPKWVANQWKKDPEATDKAAHEAVESGTHKWVQAGDHEYAVHKDIDVHVPKDIDLHSESAVKGATKVLVKKDEAGEPAEHLVLHSSAEGSSAVPEEPKATTQGTKEALKSYWKKLPEAEPKKAVSFDGKQAAWVPASWKVYKSPHGAESDLTGKWGKDPQGTWHFIDKAGKVKPTANAKSAMEDWVSSGAIIRDDNQADQHAPLPGPGQEGPAKAKAEVPGKEGGISLTKEELHQALEILQKDKSTAVKQPLAKAGHKLAAMDYHQVAADELAKHPELKVAAGTKKEHVGQVKLAVMHHLSGRAAHLAKTEAEAAALDAAQDKAQAAAGHAQQLTPHSVTLPKADVNYVGSTEPATLTATAEQVQDAIDALTAAKSTAIKQVLKAKGSPLADVNYWDVIHAYEAEHPNTAPKQTGTKQQHVGNAKQLFIAALTEKAGLLQKADDASGHTEAAELHDLVHNGKVKDGANHNPVGAIALAAKLADSYNATHYAWPLGGEWAAGFMEPTTPHWFKVTPELKATDENGDSADSLLWNAAHLWLEQPAEVPLYKQAPGGPKVPAESLAEKKAVLKELLTKPAPGEAAAGYTLPDWAQPDQWKKDPDWKAIDAKVKALHEDQLYSAQQSQALPDNLARLLYYASENGFSYYLVKGQDGKWGSSFLAPESGTYAFDAGLPFYEVTPDHRVILHAQDGKLFPKAAATILDILKNGVQPHDEPAAPEKPVNESVIVYGKKFAAGSKVYFQPTTADTSGNPGVKYVNLPDGSWASVSEMGSDALSGPQAKFFAGLVKTGQLVPEGGDKSGLEKLKEASDKVAEQQAQGVPALSITGVYAGEFPPGSKVYHKDIGSYGGVYARDPSGQWWAAIAVGGPFTGEYVVKQAASYMVSDKMLDGQTLVPMEPPTAQQLAQGKQVADALALLETGAASSEGATGQLNQAKAFPSWAQAAAWTLANDKGSTSAVDVIKVPGGWAAGWLQSGTQEHYSVHVTDLTVDYQPPEGDMVHDSPDLKNALLQGVNGYVTPNAVLVDGKVYQGGYWKNPKGKSYLLVKPKGPGYGTDKWKYGSAAFADYTYYGADNKPKDITPAAAAKQLAKATEYSAVPFPLVVAPPSKFSYATVLEPGTYKFWSDALASVDETATVEVKADGSAVLHDGSENIPLQPDTVQAMLKGGAVLDQFGTTVVTPGTEPYKYHVWGSPAKTKEELQGLLDQLADPEAQWLQLVMDFFGGKGSAAWDKSEPFGKEFMKASNSLGGDAQRAALIGLAQELLAVPGLPEGTKVGGGDGPGAKTVKTLTFLKAMPEGITSAKDIFTFTPEGNALPFEGAQAGYHTYTKPELKALVTEISQQFGDGQVVGTHPASLSAAQLLEWAKAWSDGDMEAVFALDAQSGKVSPAHPGAPDNTETHHVTWSPLDPHQVPASKDIPGEWSSLEYVPTLPAAEVDNYLIKMGFQHAEHLYDYERNAVVRYHRQHNQASVNIQTKTANERFAQGQPPHTEPPVWTEGLKPAKPYDASLKDGSPAANWSTQALTAFVKDHQDELLPAIQKAGDDNGYTTQYLIDNQVTWILSPVVQEWLDTEQQKVIAEQSVPVWKKVPTGDLPSHGHEVWKVTRTIPYTGDVTTWYAKPAAGSIYRLEQEHAANLLGRLFGFASAESQILDAKELGEVVQAQKAVPGSPLGHYTDLPPWSSFAPKAVADIATEHLLDWFLSNDDTSANNMIQKADGHVVGIDKGRAWGDLNWDGLAGNANADSMTQTVYTKLYEAVRNHQVSKDTADKAYTQVIQRARKMAAVPDARVQALLEQGFAHRAKWGQFGSRQGLIDELLRRKNSLEADFAKLWGQVYQDAGIGNLPEVPQARLPDAHGAPLHSGFSEPDFTGHVAAAKSHGVPAFFGGQGLRGMHVLVWQQNDGQGAKVTHGETFMEGSTYDKVVSWLKAHSGKTEAAVEDTTVTYGGDQYGPGKAPAGSDRGGITGEAGFYNAVIRAARSATKHKADGDYTSPSSTQVWNDLKDTAEKLQELKIEAESTYSLGTDAKEVQKAANVIEMAKLYLGYAAEVQKARQAGSGFQAGDLPRWLPPTPDKPEAKDELSALGIKLSFGNKAKHDQGALDETTGEFNPSSYGSPHSDPGSWWNMSLPDGEQVEFGNSGATGVQLAHQGRIRFTTKDGSAASLERVRSALQLAGLDMKEAEPADFERYYWRHLLGVMNDRADSSKQPVWGALKAQFEQHGLKWPGPSTGNPGTSGYQKVIDALEALGQTDPEAEVQAYRAAFATLTSPGQVEDWASSGGFYPRQKHFDPTSPTTAGGKPDWYRFDLAAKVKDLPMPIRQSSASGTAAERAVKGGGSYGMDALMRVAGIQAAGMGNPYDTGGPAFVFTRLNVTNNRALVFSPLTLARSENYSFNDDTYGRWSARHTSAYWDSKVWSHYTQGDNETQINDALSLLDDIELAQAASESDRAELIAWLKERGINEIRHLPVEDRIVTHIGTTQLAKVKQNYVDHPELLDPLGDHGLPYTGTTEPEAKAAEKGGTGEQEAQAAESGKAAAEQDTMSSLLNKVMTAGLGEGWTAKPNKHWVNGDYIIAQNTSGTFTTYKGGYESGTQQELGTVDTILEAKQLAEQEQVSVIDSQLGQGEEPPF